MACLHITVVSVFSSFSHIVPDNFFYLTIHITKANVSEFSSQAALPRETAEPITDVKFFTGERVQAWELVVRVNGNLCDG